MTQLELILTYSFRLKAPSQAELFSIFYFQRVILRLTAIVLITNKVKNTHKTGFFIDYWLVFDKKLWYLKKCANVLFHFKICMISLFV